MKYIPYDYQEYALKFILNRKAAGIFLDCGLGKTVITLTAIAELMHNYFEIARALGDCSIAGGGKCMGR